MIRIAILSACIVICFSSQAQCTVNIQSDTVNLYYGYTPLSCDTLVATAFGSGPIQYAWSTGSTTPFLSVCDTSSSWYFVSISDSLTCSSMDSVFVNVIDVRCGNNPNNQKVLVCHVPPGNPANEHTICVSENAVSAHLAHGCYLGTCASDTSMIVSPSQSQNALQMSVFPNPLQRGAWIKIHTTQPSSVLEIFIVDELGRRVQTISNSLNLEEGETMIPLEDLSITKSAGLRWIVARDDSGSRIIVPIYGGE